MYAIECLKKRVGEAAAELRRALEEIDSPEFAKQYASQYGVTATVYAAKAGALTTHLNIIARTMEGYIINVLSGAEPEINFNERLAAVMQILGVEDEQDLTALELLVSYSSLDYERRQLYEKVRKTIGEVIESENEIERDNTVVMLEAAGFTEDPEDGDFYNRLTPNGSQRILIEWRRKDNNYSFLLEVDGRETLRGVSGEFGKLLEAVGVSQNVEVKK